jgi:8-oxo-dGTP pyrophosphatase MutT (NUDIX family)
MDFQLFIDSIPKILQETILGDVSHQKMCPPERKDLMKTIDLQKINPREAAVMMLIYPKNKKTYLALILRNSYNGVHSSQIAFPGGKVEKTDADFQGTALRETEEEIGVKTYKINIIKPFTKVYIPPSNFMVYPFLGYSETELDFIADPNEVAGIIELPLYDFLDEKIVVSRKIETSYNVDIQVPAFKIHEHIVWGATAMMLSELKDVLKKVL